MTDYVATRWYRAPEILLTSKVYTKAIDVWSVGCILGELLLRIPILPGTNAQNQLELIFNLIGTPSAEDIEAIPNLKSKEKVLRVPHRSSCLDSKFSGCNPEAVDLLKQMLVFDPNKRITVDMALNHLYFAQLHFPEDEPITESVSYFDFLFEREVPSMEELKDKIYEEILLYHFPQKKEEYERLKRSSPLFLSSPSSLRADLHESSDEEEMI
jgi:mitogen-activated protein kinase 1/3